MITTRHNNMTINMIAAVADNRAIGRDGDQPYYISGDLKRFKALTTGHPIIMGRRTFEALPRGPLPGRTNIILTRDTGYIPLSCRDDADVIVVRSVDEALEAAAASPGADNVYVIGGGMVYDLFMPRASRLFLTRIYAPAAEADTFFPDTDEAVWRVTDTTERLTDPKTGLEYTHITMER